MKRGFGADALEAPSRETILRFLTVLCFFQFAGLQNGWVKLSVPGPVDAQSSVRAVGTLAGDFCRMLHPLEIHRTIQAGCSSLIRFVNSEVATLKNQAGHQQFVSFHGIHQCVAIKESWLKLPKVQPVNCLASVQNGGKYSLHRADASGLAQIKQVLREHSRARKKNAGPRIVYASNDDAASRFDFISGVFI